MSEYRSVDGANNNPNDPDLGKTDTQLIRLSSADYGDGISSLAGQDRPEARTISNEVFAQDVNTGNEAGHSDMLWMWGQFIDHDISITENGLTEEDEANMDVPTGDLMFDPAGSGNSEISFTRSVFDPETGTSTENPRQQINEITPFLDASMVYGSDQERLDALRGEGGKLLMSDGDLLAYNVDELPNAPSTSPTLFLAGDVRANENVGLTSLHTLLAREHNRLVDVLAESNPEWAAETLFNEARHLVEAEVQIITYNEFLPTLVGPDALAKWSEYDADINPQVANEFSTAAFRLGHTLLTSEIMRVQEDGSESEFGHLQLRDAFFRPDRLANEGGISEILRGAAVGQSEELDANIVDDVRNFLFGSNGASGFDLAALNIQRGRDHGLEDYNDVREAVGLTRVEGFDEITSDPELQATLESLYGTVDNIDLFVGGLSEDAVEGSLLGELFQTIVTDQFTRLRDGDSFWHENILSNEQMALVENVTLASLIERNSDVEHMQDDVFTAFTREVGSRISERLNVADDHVLALAGAGDDTVKALDGTQQIHGEEGRDWLYGGSGNDIIYGDEDRDHLFGQNDNDQLNGGSGRDVLSAGEGDDRLNGGDDRDSMHGGAGSDVFVMSQGRDMVMDFNKNEDVLDFSYSDLITSIDDLTVTQSLRGISLTDSNGDGFYLQGIFSTDNIQAIFNAQTEAGEAEPEEETPVEDIITGGHTDLLWGTEGDDLFGDTEGTQYVAGRGGVDTFIVNGSSDNYTIEKVEESGMVRLTGNGELDILWDMEIIRFEDGTFSLADDALIAF